MKIRKKTMHLRGDSKTNRWFLGEKVERLPDGRQHLSGKVYEVTDSIQPAITHTNTYVRRLEDALVKCVYENYRLRGITPTDEEVLARFNQLKDEVSH